MEGMPTPPTETPPAETKQATGAKRVGAGSPRSLRYRWMQDQTFQYRVKSELQLSAGVETLEGTVHYPGRDPRVPSDGWLPVPRY